MFDTLQDRLAATFKSLRSKGRLTDADIDATAREIRIALLEADVNLSVVKEFVEHYGAGLFTQHVLAPGSLRGILRGGVRRWIASQMARAEGSHE